MQNAIEINGLKKVYKSGLTALKSVELSIGNGDFFALLGANGAGKTTMIGILTGIVTKTAGSVKIFGHDIEKEHNLAKRMIGVVPQEFNFNFFETVSNIVLQQAGYFGITRKEAAKNLEPILKVLDLWDKKDTSAIKLSGGMKRRLMIARALIHKPKLLILDEPTAGVDVELRHGMWDYLRKINEEGVTILLTTHYIEEAEALCKNVAIIKSGEIVKSASVKELTKSMDFHTYTAQIEGGTSPVKIAGFDIVEIDDTTIEVVLKKGQTINELIAGFNAANITVQELSVKGN